MEPTYKPYEKDNKGQQNPHQNPPRPEQAPRPKVKVRPSLSYRIWQFSDPQMIDELAQRYLAGMGAGTARAYLLGTVLLVLATGLLTWGLDVGPTYNFVSYLVSSSPEITSFLAPYASLIPAFILLFALLPALLEFFSIGMALQGSLAMDIAIKIAIIFDAVTDLPGAQKWASVIVSYFIPLDTPLGGLISFLATLIVLFFATIAIETLFLSFSLALARIIKQAVLVQTHVRA